MSRTDPSDEQRLTELLAGEAGEPRADLVERIMAGIDTAERSRPVPESAVDRWNRAAWPVAVTVAAAAALAVCVAAFTVEDTVAVDPIAAITADDADLDQVLALSRR